MTIGFCRLVLHLPEAGSLKQKRSVLESLTTRIRQKFNVSISEIDAHDLWQKAVVGVAVVSSDSAFSNQVLNKVVKLVEAEHRAQMIDYSVEMM